ncbi:hypothetical protein GEOBRER4_n2076 [Citrifermentans bremense]|uniref:Uncharacterized protein n=1 Tax=Citrifermentans bremense TaxID=60035 RepID=A0A7R7FSE5_9BACT|nr:hypothetical protein [Citrifermentans bremense]BCO11387.1 hypothetical protein GEOBRER4_n2076 [Citrifermentans bremense]
MAKSLQIAVWKPTPLSRLPKEQLPVEMFRSFKKQLGEINSHLCIVDVALQDFVLDHAHSEDSRAFIRQRALAHGHRRLGTDKLDLEFALGLAYTSQIALLLSRLEQLCHFVQKHGMINPKFKELMEGDFLRRTLWLIASSRKGEKVASPLPEEIAISYITPLDLAIFDFYRKIRNSELHAANNRDLTELRSKIDMDRCRSELGHAPTPQGDLSFKDVLVVSKTCQRIGRNVCRAVADPNRDIIPELKRRFGSHPVERRQNAARSLITHAYLLDEADVGLILSELAW